MCTNSIPNLNAYLLQQSTAFKQRSIDYCFTIALTILKYSNKDSIDGKVQLYMLHPYCFFTLSLLPLFVYMYIIYTAIPTTPISFIQLFFFYICMCQILCVWSVIKHVSYHSYSCNSDSLLRFTNEDTFL